MGGTVKALDVTTVFEAQDRLHVVYPKGHPIARLKTVTPVALAEFPLILMQRDTSVRAIVDAGFHSAGLMPKATCEAIYMMTAVGMVRAGLGLTILPGSAREIKAEPGLLSKPIDDPSFTQTGLHHQEVRTNPSAAERGLPRTPFGLSQGGARVVGDCRLLSLSALNRGPDRRVTKGAQQLPLWAETPPTRVTQERPLTCPLATFVVATRDDIVDVNSLPHAAQRRCHGVDGDRRTIWF